MLIYLNPNYSKEKALLNLKSLENPFFVSYPEDMLIGALQSKMDVKLMNELARTLEITVKDYNPEKAADILNNISEEFIDFEKENKRASSQSVINFINEQLMQISDTLKTSENGIQSYTKNNNIIRNDEIFKSKLSKITSVEEQLLSIDLEHRILDTLKKI